MKRILFSLILLSSIQAFSQKRTCGTTIVNAKIQQRILAENPATAIRKVGKNIIEEFETGKRTTTVYNIPVIVHVINNGEPSGTGTNISAAQVQTQIDALNEDYRNLNTDGTNAPAVFQGARADVQLNFCLAAINKNGNFLSERGIDRISRSSKGWTAPPFSDTYIDATIKPATIWDPTKFLNIWVLSLGNDLLGYAQFPDNTANLGGIDASGGPANTDGVVILYTAFGKTGAAVSPYNKGRTTTHEIGHFFGLRHIWGDASCGNDYCADTPKQEAENTGCPSFPHVTCSNGANGDMFMNYMDYVNDACMFMFSNDQKTRIQGVMAANTPRRTSLATSTVCNSNIPPVADFSYNPSSILTGANITFTDISSGIPSTWSWDFGTAGTPTTSSVASPSVKFNTPGTYPVKLTINNAIGTSSIIKNITVTQFNCADQLTNFTGTPTLLTVPSTGTGYISGHNSYTDKAKADKIAYAGTPLKVNKLLYFFGLHKGTGNITATIWNSNGTSGIPGTPLFTQVFPIVNIQAAGSPTIVTLATPITITADFYIGFTMTYVAGDTVALLTNTNATNNTAWERWSNNTWHAYTETTSWTKSLNLEVYALYDNRTSVAASATKACSIANITTTASTIISDANCGIIAKLLPSGNSSLSGFVNGCVKSETTVPYYNNQPFVKRHYEITPVLDPANATGTITLYFTDADFSSFNAARGIYPALPTVAGGGNTDPAKGNVYITQYHGTSTTGLPGSYSAGAVEINPDDNNIVWNNTLSLWEVTFNVTGFSGFFVHSGSTALPITMQYFKGQKQGNINSLAWKSNCLSASVKFEIERSDNGRNFTSIGNITATQVRCASPFDYTDNHPLPGVNYYRLKMTEVGGNISYSKIITLFNKDNAIEIVSLVPTLINKGKATLNVSSAKQGKLELMVTDIQGRLVQKTLANLEAGYNTIDLDFNNLSTGSYNISGHASEGKTRTLRFVKQ